MTCALKICDNNIFPWNDFEFLHLIGFISWFLWETRLLRDMALRAHSRPRPPLPLARLCTNFGDPPLPMLSCVLYVCPLMMWLIMKKGNGILACVLSKGPSPLEIKLCFKILKSSQILKGSWRVSNLLNCVRVFDISEGFNYNIPAILSSRILAAGSLLLPEPSSFLHWQLSRRDVH